MQRFFITGTDTDCGKTFVTCALLGQGLAHTLAIKPIASGLVFLDEKWQSPDVVVLNKHNPPHSFDINPWCFKTPVSPNIAASLEGLEVTLEALSDFCFHPQFEGYEQLFIEGAGGLMAPITDSYTWVDFLKETKIPSIIVVGMKLGCLSHALMTVSVLKSHSLPIHGFIANQIDPNMLAFDENLATLQSRLEIPYLGIVPYNPA